MSQPLTKGQIKKKNRHEISYLDTHTQTLFLTHIHTHHVLQKQDKTYGNAQDETVITVSTSSILHGRKTNHSYTHEGGFLFHRHGKKQ